MSATLLISHGEKSNDFVNVIMTQYKNGIHNLTSYYEFVSSDLIQETFRYYIDINGVSSYIFVNCVPSEGALNFLISKVIRVTLVNDKNRRFQHINSIAHSRGCATPLKCEELEYQALVTYNSFNFTIEKDSASTKYKEDYKNWALNNIVAGSMISTIHDNKGYKVGLVLFTPVDIELIKNKLLDLTINGDEPDFILVCSDINIKGEIQYTILRNYYNRYSEYFSDLDIRNFSDKINVMKTIGKVKKHYENYDSAYGNINVEISDLNSKNQFFVSLTGVLQDIFGESAIFRLSSSHVPPLATVANFYIVDGKVVFPDHHYIDMTVEEFLSQMTRKS